MIWIVLGVPTTRWQ